LMTLGQWDRALPVLARITEFDPTDGEILEQMTVCHFELGHRQSALNTGHRLSTLPGFEPVGYLQLASMYTEWESPLNAIRYYKKVLQYRPDASDLSMPAVDFFLAYADAMLAAGNTRQAIDILKRSEHIQPTNQATRRLGEASRAIGNMEQAKEYFEALIGEDGEGRIARQRLAEMALGEEDAAEAVELLSPLVEQDRLTAEAAFLLVRAYTLLGDDPQAIKWQSETTALRLENRKLRVLEAEIGDRPSTPRGITIAAYLSAHRQDWKTAGQLLASLLRQMPEAYEVPFVQQLVDAVRNRSTLPDIDSLPQVPDR